VSALVFKEIKPQRLKEAAMRAELVKGMKEIADGIEQDYQKTVATWGDKPKFEQLFDLGPPITMLVGTDNEIYGYVDKGTKDAAPYPIFAGIYTGKSSKKALAFPSQSTPKTKPNVIGSFGGSRGKVDTVRAYVIHPGIEPRNFSKEITKKWTPRFKRRMEKAMSRAAKASGHAL